jgi:hypothetical protein
VIVGGSPAANKSAVAGAALIATKATSSTVNLSQQINGRNSTPVCICDCRISSSRSMSDPEESETAIRRDGPTA